MRSILTSGICPIAVISATVNNGCCTAGVIPDARAYTAQSVPKNEILKLIKTV